MLKLSNGLQIYLVEDPAATEVTWELKLDYTPFLEGKQSGMMALVGAMLGQGSDAYTAEGLCRRTRIDERIVSKGPPQGLWRNVPKASLERC